MSVLLRRAIAFASILSVGLLGPVGLSACTTAEAPPAAATTEAPTVAPLPESGNLNAGTYLVTSFTEPFEVTIPDGWNGGDVALSKDDPDHPGEGAVFVAWWPAPYVSIDPCAWHGALVKLEPSAKAFVDAMTAQTATASTPPVEVVVGDYSGFEFDHSVEGDVDIAACDEGKFCVHAESLYQCSRWYSTQTERETYRVVDLNGQRAVVWMAQYRPPINPELTREARAVFDSIVFKSNK